ncbi:Pre-mRNA-splicing ATP-dependent RNA helicase PRP28 [Verticillium dahliae VDG1]|nr:Pre-mRNA-splicing ATP-dependent RNA helicase PRP28 [Verticillium dahliae VDG1]
MGGSWTTSSRVFTFVWENTRQSGTTAIQETPDKHFPLAEPVYTPPTTCILSVLPKSWVPYAELIRIDKPTGTYYLFFPCLFSTLMAAPMAMPMASPLSVLGTTFLFFSGALIMRGAGCTINDLWDRNLDPHVTRTRFRPIARRAVTPFNALDDAKAGIKSIALKHDADTKKVLTGLAAVQIGLLGAAGVAAGAGPAFFVGSCGGALVTLGIMIKRVNLKSVKDCWWWFVNGCWITGGVISMGLGMDYAVRYAADDEDNKAIVQ